MIPRQQGLVPVIGAPRHCRVSKEENAAKQAQLRETPATVVRSPIVSVSQFSALFPASQKRLPEWMEPDAKHAAKETTCSELNNMRLYSVISISDPPQVPKRLFAIQTEGETSTGGLGSEGGGRSTGKRRRERREAHDRLLYRAEDGRTTQTHTASHWCSVPVPEYGRLKCVVIRPGVDLCDGSVDTNRPPCVATTLSVPLLELREERQDAPRLAEGSISTIWHSQPSASFNKRDWKSMDDYEGDSNAHHSRTEDALPDSTNDDALLEERRRNKKAKYEASAVKAVEAARAATSVIVDTLTATTKPAPRSPSLLTDSRVLPATATPSCPGTKGSSNPTSSRAPTAVPPASSGAGERGGGLDECGATVLNELIAEGKTSVTLKDLERLVLKRLPMYAAMAEKAKTAATRGEASQWFRSSQAALKAWLVHRGNVVDPTGTVHFN